MKAIQCDLYLEFDKRAEDKAWANLMGEIKVTPKVSRLRIVVSNVPETLEHEVREVVQHEISRVRKNLGWVS